ncbi:hypothetical protein E3T26_14375 [Cryobacterium sp. TMT1-21]|uniref:hypothetical protein n=1 Tax=Cryobacterium sp. TMT1-21 TaxID=1259234 RepID=UPI00106D14B8|nr:hypothetical protein [Cryobacterium sp. TMT1-21]TFD09810.1 hypothetical protein E3T26_14375 [Cryobacterium sp. TMT1-21]
MNKYTAVGLLAAAAEGKRIIVVSPHGSAVRDAVDEVHQLAPDLQWRRTNGATWVALPAGGSIRFLTRPQLRGQSADVVLVEDDRDLNVDVVRELHAVVKASPDGEIVRY